MTNGILLALIAYASYSGSDAVVKSLGGQLTIFEIGFFITLFAGFFLFFTRPAGERWRDFWRTKRPWAVQARAWAGIASGVLSVYAFTTIPLAESYALIFLAPLCVTILSTVILKEKVGPWRWLAVVAGFAGVMLVVRPGFRELNLGHLAAFGVAFLAATSVILMRSLAQQEKRTTMLGVLVGCGLLFNGIGAAATAFTVPSGRQLLWLAMAGAFTAGGQFLQLLAMKYAPAKPRRADPLFADRLGGDPRRVVLPGISGRAVAGWPGGRWRCRPVDHGAGGSAAGHRALEPVFAHPALNRSGCALAVTADMRAP